MAYIVGLHVATAIALIIYFWHDWVRIVTGAERLRHRDPDVNSEYVDERVGGPESDARLAMQSVGSAVQVGTAQIAALAPGISRSGVTMVAGTVRGLSRDHAARFSFLLATPVILATGVLKIPDLVGPLGSGIRGQVLFGAVLSGVGAYLSVRFLTRYLVNRSLRLWVPIMSSGHDARVYSWTMAPTRSWRWTRMVSRSVTGSGSGRSGAAWPRERCGRCWLWWVS